MFRSNSPVSVLTFEEVELFWWLFDRNLIETSSLTSMWSNSNPILQNYHGPGNLQNNCLYLFVHLSTNVIFPGLENFFNKVLHNFSPVVTKHGANPTTVSCNASAVKNYNATTSLVLCWSNESFFYFEKRCSLLQRWCCSCKFRSRRIGSLSKMIHLRKLN
jgi:hypothetical protein